MLNIKPNDTIRLVGYYWSELDNIKAKVISIDDNRMIIKILEHTGISIQYHVLDNTIELNLNSIVLSNRDHRQLIKVINPIDHYPEWF